MTSAMENLGRYLVVEAATLLHALLTVVPLETLLVFGSVAAVGVALAFRPRGHKSWTPVPLVALGSLAILGLGPTMSPLQPFNMSPYHASYFDFATQAGWPTFPPLLPPNETLSTRGPWFVDASGRTLLLRGVNVGGITKLPSKPDGATHLNNTEGFWEKPREVSFVDRPFPLAEADEHFGRLASWGLTFVRLLVTWEAVEHAGPGIYDEDYLTYLVALVRKADQHGIAVFVDPHQDVWSRFSGGSGAPAWTLSAVGFDVTKLDATGAAVTHQGHGDPLPAMIWSTNNWRLATATMFTLFFAGDTYAPGIAPVGEEFTAFQHQSLQAFLQGHFCAAMAKVASALRAEHNVVGFDTLNEPNSGWIGRQDLASRSDGLAFIWGLDLSPFELMAVGSGVGPHAGTPDEAHQSTPSTSGASSNSSSSPQPAQILNPPFVRLHQEWVNPEALSAWLPRSGGCIWQRAGVWRVHPSSGQPELLKPAHFAFEQKHNRSPKNWVDAYVVPFWRRFESDVKTAAQRPLHHRSIADIKASTTSSFASHQPLLIFAEPPVDFADPSSHTPPALGREEEGLNEDDGPLTDWVYAPHWYEVVNLITKSYCNWVGLAAWTWPVWQVLGLSSSFVGPVLGREGLVNGYSALLGGLKHAGSAVDSGSGMPTLIGEIGIAMDLNGGTAFLAPEDPTAPLAPGAPGDWSAQIAAFDNLMRALDNNLLSFTLWNYTPQNTNERGDLWNGEDLSLWSNDQKLSHAHPNDPYAGGRALPAVMRPHARKVSGVPLRQEFTLDSREFELVMQDYAAGSAAAQKLLDGVPTEVFVPRYQYPKGVDVEVSSGHYDYDPERQVLLWWHGDRAVSASNSKHGSAGAPGGRSQQRTHRLLLKDTRNRPKGTAAEEWARYVNEKEASGVFTAADPGPGGSERAATHVPQVSLSTHGHVIVTVPHGMQRDHFVEAVWARDADTGKVLAATQLHPSDADHGRPDADEAKLNFALQPGGGTTHVVAFASCNLHGVWSSDPVAVLKEEGHSEL